MARLRTLDGPRESPAPAVRPPSPEIDDLCGIDPLDPAYPQICTLTRVQAACPCCGRPSKWLEVDLMEAGRAIWKLCKNCLRRAEAEDE